MAGGTATGQRRARRAVPILGVVAIVAAATVATATVATMRPAEAESADASDKASELTMVRFTPGTLPAVVQAAARAAGGSVIDNSLAPLGVAIVQPTRSDFRSRVRTQPGVVAAWQPTLVRYGTHESDGSKPNGLPKESPGRTPSFPDPLHNATSFLGETNPRHILQWDDLANGATKAWNVTKGDPTVRVAVIDTGVDIGHRDLATQVDASYNFLPCRQLRKAFGTAFDPHLDCQRPDGDGHGTWVAGRIAAAANGFASNGIAPNVRILSYKALSASLGGGATAWIVAAMVHACSVGGADIVNFSLGGYENPADPDSAQDYLLWVDGVNFCTQRGVAVIAAAGNDHVRVDRVDMTLAGRALTGVGRVSAGPEGYTFHKSISPGDPQPGYLEAPAGVPGVLMVSATGNATAPPTADLPLRLAPPPSVVGRLDQLAYYSNYGPRVDVAAPGGARKFNLPRSDGGPNNLLYGGWGILSTTVGDGVLCSRDGAPMDFACFELEAQAFAWLQGSSMSAPSASGVAALVLSGRPELRDRPAALFRVLQRTARTDMVNGTPPLSPTDSQPAYDNTPCDSGGYCHLDWQRGAIPFSDAYGAGMVNAGAAVGSGWSRDRHDPSSKDGSD